MTKDRPGIRCSEVLLCAAFSLLAGLWSAEAVADCGTAPFSVAQPAVERFVLRPPTLLQDFPQGGEAMENRVALITGSSRAALRPLIGMLTRANQRQREAMAAGLASAARGCERTRLASSRHIERTVRASGDSAFIRDFASRYKSPAALPPVAPTRPATGPSSTGAGARIPGIHPDPGGNAVRPIAPVR